LKCLGKGLTNFVNNGGVLDNLEYNNLDLGGDVDLIN